jgi:hypothetical protein
MYFVAYEGSGAIADNSFSKTDIETIDFMPNGQLRFGIYDSQGNPTMAASSELTAAGKPSKCLWCHEIRLQDPFKNSTSVAGYYSAPELREVIRNRMGTVDKYRDTLRSQIDFHRTGDHTFAELLYLSFAEPSAARLALEWGMPEVQVAARLRGLRTHRQKEFPYLGEALYDRSDVDRLAPYPTIRVPSDVREPSAYEPNLLPSEPHP